jgi:hypothetical protein
VKSTNRRRGILAVIVTAALCTVLVGVGLSTGAHRAEPMLTSRIGVTSSSPFKQLRPLCSLLRRHCATRASTVPAPRNSVPPPTGSTKHR